MPRCWYFLKQGRGICCLASLRAADLTAHRDVDLVCATTKIVIISKVHPTLHIVFHWTLWSHGYALHNATILHKSEAGCMEGSSNIVPFTLVSTLRAYLLPLSTWADITWWDLPRQSRDEWTLRLPKVVRRHEAKVALVSFLSSDYSDWCALPLGSVIGNGPR